MSVSIATLGLFSEYPIGAIGSYGVSEYGMPYKFNKPQKRKKILLRKRDNNLEKPQIKIIPIK